MNRFNSKEWLINLFYEFETLKKLVLNETQILALKLISKPAIFQENSTEFQKFYQYHMEDSLTQEQLGRVRAHFDQMLFRDKYDEGLKEMIKDKFD